MPDQLKQVRFAYQNTFHSPPTPALTFGSSLPSSSGPSTPPSTHQAFSVPSPYAMPYVSQKQARAPAFAGRVRPHRYLEASGVKFDLMDSPSHITRNHHTISGRQLGESATNPPLPFLTITCIYFPWAIKVYATNGSFVSLGDVFDGIYRSLRTNLTQQDFDWLPGQREQLRATQAYEQRYRRFRNRKDYDAEKRSGMKRVDFLMGHTRFLGISNTGRRPDEWLLNLT